MHACGHDMHMTTALGLLDQLVQVQPKNNLLFLFQPAEENEAGGMLMYKAVSYTHLNGSTQQLTVSKVL